MTEIPDLAPLSEAEREELRRLRVLYDNGTCRGTDITGRIDTLASREDIVDPDFEARVRDAVKMLRAIERHASFTYEPGPVMDEAFRRLRTFSNPESSSRKDSTNA